MKALLFLAVAMPIMSFAQADRPQRERNLLNAVNETRRVINTNIRFMTDEDLLRATKLLEKVQEVAQGTIIDPTPIRPTCAQEMNVSLYQQTFIKVKDFAYSSTGLNYGSQTAVDYAHAWTAKHPCDRADSFIKDSRRLKDFAYSTNGLNYGSTQAVEFAIQKVDRFCSQYPLESTYRQQYDFAYSSTGLNYGSTQARDYAWAKIEPVAFTCVNQ